MPFDNGATVEFTVSERLPAPSCDTGDILVPAVQETANVGRPNQLIRFLPIVTALATVGVMAAAYASRSSMARNPVFLLFPLVMLVSAMATVLAGADRRRGELDDHRRDHFARLAVVRAVVAKTVIAQHESQMWRYPDPDTLWSLIGGPRMWERGAEDSDFCQVRIGMGTVPLARRLIAPVVEHRQDPVSASALQRLIAVQSVVAGLPVTVSLRGSAAVGIRGDATRARALVRAMVCQLAVMHSPDTVGIAAVVSAASRSDWEWLKWLPHNRHPYDHDGVGPARMVYPSVSAARDALDMPDRQLVVIVDTGEHSDGLTGSVLTIDGRCDEPPVVVAAGEDVSAQPDRLSGAAALVCAQRLAGYRPTEASSRGWQDLVGVADVASFSPSAGRGRRLRVPVGTTVAGAAVELDINEAAAHGMGPHGLCIGATGSGKSEFLRTVALGMIVGHSPDELNLILVDFKGGATFAGTKSQVIHAMLLPCAQRSTPAFHSTRPVKDWASSASSRTVRRSPNDSAGRLRKTLTTMTSRHFRANADQGLKRCSTPLKPAESTP